VIGSGLMCCPRHLQKEIWDFVKEKGLDMVVFKPSGTFGPA